MTRAYEEAIVVVTGASTGLGRSIAAGAAAAGARAVVINYASSTAEAEATARLVEAAGAAAVLVQGDVGEDADCRRVAAAAEPHGRIDALFNNAGVSRAVAHGDLDALNGEDFLALYRINVVGAFQMTRAARPLLLASDAAAIVNTSSIAGVTGGGSSIAYSASKGALNVMTLSLARALAPHIRVNAICPGFIDTPWFDKIGAPGGRDAIREQMRRTTPLQKVAGPDDVAQTALFLGSRAAGHITGETLLIDGGSHLGPLPRIAQPAR